MRCVSLKEDVHDQGTVGWACSHYIQPSIIPQILILSEHLLSHTLEWPKKKKKLSFCQKGESTLDKK